MRDYEPNQLRSPQLVTVKSGESEEAVATLLGFQLHLPLSRRAVIGVLFHVNERPGTIARSPSPARLVVLGQPLLGILANADVKAWAVLAAQNIDEIGATRDPRHREGWLRGLDLNQRSRMRDYESNELPPHELVGVKAGEPEEAGATLLAL
jgi:hypothetical protein